jgi:predicted HTH transcriptional regulator
MTGAELIAKERQEQIEKHGRTVQMDVDHNRAYQLAEAASVLTTEKFRSTKHRFSLMPDDWDDEISLKMCKKGRKERLIIAGALIAAEIDRIIENERTTF